MIAVQEPGIWAITAKQSRSMPKPTTLVTGANGYAGGFLCRHLAAVGVPTRGLYYAPDGEPDFAHGNLELVPGDLRDRDGLRRALDGIEVVHNVAALYRTAKVPNRLYDEVNVEGVRNIVELAAAAGVRRFVHCSTIGVHGHVEQPPADEDAPLKPNDYYQLSKLRGERIALERGRELGLDVAALRPAAIYGPRERRFLGLARLLHRRRFVMFGSGEVLYHFIHVADLCEAFVLAAGRPEAVGEAIIIADDGAITLNRIVAILCAELGVPPPRLRLPLAALYVPSVLVEFACRPLGIEPPLHRRRAQFFWATRAFDIGKARRRLGFAPRVGIEDGLRDMVRSYRGAGWLDDRAGRARAGPGGPAAGEKRG
jgi:nucleoside-diphosphate-sugar epimerase